MQKLHRGMALLLAMLLCAGIFPLSGVAYAENLPEETVVEETSQTEEATTEEVISFGADTLAYAASSAVQKGKQDPDMIYTRDTDNGGNNPGYYTSVTDSEVKDYLNNTPIDKKEATDQNGQDDFDNGSGDKQAFWTSDDKSTADIVISYYKPIRSAVYLTSLCFVHPTKANGLKARNIHDQVKAISDQIDVDVFLEGRDFLGGRYNGQDVYYYNGNTKASEQTFHVKLNHATGDSLDLVREWDDGSSLFGLTINGEQQTDGPWADDRLAIAADESNATAGLLVFGENRGTVTTRGAHSNILEYARDINSVFRGLSEEEKPDFVVISFDSWAWANSSFARESDDWHEDAADMREAAGYLAPYYKNGRVLLLTPQGTLQDPSTVAAIATNPAASGARYNNSRESMVMHLYPHAVQATRNNADGTTTDINWTALEDFENKPYADPTVIDALDGALSGYPGNNGKQNTVLGQDVLTHSQVVYDYVTDGPYRRLGTNNGPSINTKDHVDYYTMSKRIPFYQFALLDPVKYLEVTNADGTPNEIPAITEWNINQATNIPYSNSAASVAAIENLVTAHNQIVIKDTLDDGFTATAIEAFYWEEDATNPGQGEWKLIPSDYTASDDTGASTNKTDGVVATGVGGQDVSVTINNPVAMGKEVRIRIATDCTDKSFYVTDPDGDHDPSGAQPKDTNTSAIVERYNTVNNHNFNNPETNERYFELESPKLRKNPVVEIAATKKWVGDYNNAFNTREDIVMHVDRSETTKVKKKEDVLPAQKIDKTATGDSLTVTWGKLWNEEYTASDGQTVTADTNVLYAYDEDCNPFTYTVREKNASGGDLVAYTPGSASWTVAEGENKKSWREKDADKQARYDMGYPQGEKEYTNTLKTTDISVTKEWVDTKDSHSASELEGKFDLYALWNDSNEKTAAVGAYTYPDPTISPDSGKSFTIKWEKLPAYRGTGSAAPTPITYNVKEPAAFSGYADPVYTGNTVDEGTAAADGGTITNTYIPETASLSVFKAWDDNSNQDNLRKEAAKVTLEAKGPSDEQFKPVTKDVYGETIQTGLVPTKDGLIITWLNLPVKANGTDITYKITEDVSGLGGYYTNYSIENPDGFTLKSGENKEILVTNTQAKLTKEITITKEWDDQNDKEGLRPDKVTVTLSKTYDKMKDAETEKVDRKVKVNGKEYTVYQYQPEEASGDAILYFAITDSEGKTRYYRGTETISKKDSEITDYEELLLFAPSSDDQDTNGTVNVDGTDYSVKKTAEDAGDFEYYQKDGKYYSVDGTELIVFAPASSDEAVQDDAAKDPEYEVGVTEEAQKVTLKKSENWTTKVTVDQNAPVGKLITYTVSEPEPPEGYTATVTSDKDGEYIVTNKHIVPKYTITYDANGGTGTMADNNYQGGDSTMPSKENTFTRNGYDFVGFIAYDEDGNEVLGGKVFKNAEEFADYFKGKPDGTKVKLVAQWEKKEEETKTVKRTIRYWIENVDGSKAFEDVVQEYTFTRTKITNPDGTVTYGDWSETSHSLDAVNSPAKSGYTIDRASVGAVSVSPDDEDIVEDVIYTPVKSDPPAKTHWVTYIDPDGTVYTVKTNYDQVDTEIPAPTPTKEGYIFDGWDRSEDEDGNVTYVARWKKDADKPKPSDGPKQNDPKPTDNAKLTDNPKRPVPATGDDTNTAMWISLMSAALAGIAAIAVTTRRRRTGKHSK